MRRHSFLSGATAVFCQFPRKNAVHSRSFQRNGFRRTCLGHRICVDGMTARTAVADAVSCFCEAGNSLTIGVQCYEHTHTAVLESNCDLDSEHPDSVTDQIAQAVWDFEQEHAGHNPRAGSVILSDDILMIKLHEALTPAEMLLADTAVGAGWSHEVHNHLFPSASDSLWNEIERITGRRLCEVAEADARTAAIQYEFSTGTLVQVFQLV